MGAHHICPGRPATRHGTRTAYVANIGDFGPGTVTPVATSTNAAGKPIKVGAGPTALVIAR